MSNNINQFQKGFTLIEVLIAVCIVTLLATVAYPTYIAQVYKSKRATAANSILQCVTKLETRYTLTGSYTDNACQSLNNDDYEISVDVSMARRNGRACTIYGKERCFEVTAISLVEEDVSCQSMSINEKGEKFTTPNNNVKECWVTTT